MVEVNTLSLAIAGCIGIIKDAINSTVHDFAESFFGRCGKPLELVKLQSHEVVLHGLSQ